MNKNKKAMRNRQPSPLQGRIARIRAHGETRNWSREATEREISRVISSYRR